MALKSATTTLATIQMRRGREEDFDPDQMTAGEWAISEDSKKVWMCFWPGFVLRMATYEAFEKDMEEIRRILVEAQDIEAAITLWCKLAESYAHGGTGARDGEDTDNAKYYADQAKISADNAEAVSGVGIMTVDKAGIGKPDGTTITVDEDGTMHSVGGSGGAEGDFASKAIYGDNAISLGRNAASVKADRSIAYGFNAKATGEMSVSFGQSNESSGKNSFTDGYEVTAMGNNSASFGNHNVSVDSYSFSEGCGNIALGYGSHAENCQNIAGVKYVFKIASYDAAEKKFTFDDTYTGFAEAYAALVLGNKLHIANVNYINDASIYTVEYLGTDNKSVFVKENIPTSNYSVLYATLIRTGGNYGGCHVEGRKNIALAYYSHAEGYMTEARGYCSHTEGEKTTASGDCSHAEGVNTKAVGTHSHAEGNSAKAEGAQSHAEGLSTIASGKGSHAGGTSTTASGEDSFCHGNSSSATKARSVAFGNEVNSIGVNSFASGSKTTASGDNSHAEGSTTTASGDSAHAEGHKTTASGNYSHARGFNTKATGYTSTACGLGTIAGGQSQVAIGMYNTEISSPNLYPFVIGRGSSVSNRADIFQINSAGNVFAKGIYGTLGADYAEFIREWHDGNLNSEDRVGYFVTVKNGHLHKAGAGDYIVGITSGNPSIVGNSDIEYYWRWERDEFNRIIYEEKPEMIEKIGEDGGTVLDDETGNPVMVETGNIISVPKQRVDYDVSKQANYIKRSDRKEWDYVGMLGVLPVRDDGTCEVGRYCRCADGGIATLATERGFDTYMVIERVTENVVSVVLK